MLILAERRRNSGSKKKQSTNDKKEKPKQLPCYYCGKLVKSNALKCKYCGKWYSSGKKTVAFTLLLVMAILLLSFSLSAMLSSDGQESFRPPDRQPPINFDELDDLDDWEVDTAVTMPEESEDLMGRLGEIYSTYSFSLQIIDRATHTTTTHDIQMDVNTNVFIMDVETESVTEGTIADIQTASLLRVWGTQNSDGTWHATDVCLMTGMPDRIRP